jgi:hypothetical protein
MIIGLYSSVPQCGKGESAKHLWGNHNFKILSFAGPIKSISFSFLVSIGFSPEDANYYIYENKDVQIPGLDPGITGRQIQRTLGTDWGRKMIGINVWTDAVMRKIDANPDLNYVIDDIRFEQEYHALKDRGAHMIHVQRDNAYPGPLSISDGRLDSIFSENNHFQISNNGTIDELLQQVEVALTAFQSN